MPRGAASPWGRKEEHTEGVSRETELKSGSSEIHLREEGSKDPLKRGPESCEPLLVAKQLVKTCSHYGLPPALHPPSPSGGKKKMESEEAVGETSRQV